MLVSDALLSPRPSLCTAASHSTPEDHDPMGWTLNYTFSLCIAAAVLCLFSSGCKPGTGDGDPPGASADAKSTTDAGGAASAGGRELVRLGSFELDEISTHLSVAADLEAVKEADVFPEVSGIIREVRKREGEAVRADEVVVQLIDDELRLVQENKQIALEQARTKLELARLAVREALAVVDQKAVLLEKARTEWDRVSGLDSERGIVSPEEADQKRYAKVQAEMDHTAAQLAVDRSRLEEDQAEQGVDLANKELATADLNLRRTSLVSPIDGMISLLDLHPGELIGPSAMAFAVVDTSRLEARVHVPQRDLRRIEVGQRVLIHCEVFADAERPFEGRVSVINPVIDPATGTVRLIVEVDDSSGRLKPGMFIDAEVITETRKDSLLVSKKAIIYENKDPVIFLEEDGVARRYILEPGLSSETSVEVLGLRRRSTDSPLSGDGLLAGGRAVDLNLRKSREHSDGGVGVDLARGSLVLVGQNKLQDGRAVQPERRESVSSEGEELGEAVTEVDPGEAVGSLAEETLEDSSESEGTES